MIRSITMPSTRQPKDREDDRCSQQERYEEVDSNIGARMDGFMVDEKHDQAGCGPNDGK